MVILFSHTCRWVSTSVTPKEELYNVVYTHDLNDKSLTAIANVSDVYVKGLKGPQFLKVVAEVSCFYLLIYIYRFIVYVLYSTSTWYGLVYGE